jgi:hypothetical protein
MLDHADADAFVLQQNIAETEYERLHLMTSGKNSLFVLVVCATTVT